MKVPSIATLVLLLLPVGAHAQELEPGAYWPIPKSTTIATIANNFNWGDLAFDPAAPIDHASARINTTGLSLVRTFSLAGRSANVGVVVPVVAGHVEGLYLGDFAETGRFGIGDPRLRLAVNLYGAPAMTRPEFGAYRQGTIVGLSVVVAPPLGEYDSSRLINLGTNRWSFRPELGFSQTRGRWVLELMAGAWLFTDNTDFYGGRTREQDPVGAVQAHVTYKFRPGRWLAADANYFTGGRTTIGGTQNYDLMRNSRIGATFSSAIDRRSAIRIMVSRGAYTTIGADFFSIGASYSYVFGR